MKPRIALPEQHCPLLLHAWPLGKHEAAWAGVGAVIEVTNGKTIAAAMPILRMATRRERNAAGTSPSTRRCAAVSLFKASSTKASSTVDGSRCESAKAICDGLFLPLHSFNTAAAGVQRGGAGRRLEPHHGAGKIGMECVIETKASMILQFIDGLRGEVLVTI